MHRSQSENEWEKLKELLLRRQQAFSDCILFVYEVTILYGSEKLTFNEKNVQRKEASKLHWRCTVSIYEGNGA